MKMNMSFSLKVILTCLALVSISGCVDYEQQTYLNDDMSGRIDIVFSLNPQEAMKAVMSKIEAQHQPAGTKPLMSELTEKAEVNLQAGVSDKDFLSAFNVSAIKKKSYKKIEKDGKLYIYLTVEFDDISKLFEGKKNVMVTKNKDGSITYTEYFEPIGQEDKNTKQNEELLEKSRFKYVLHMPRDIINANTGMIDKNTAEWNLPLAAAYNKDFHITATMRAENRLLGLLRYFKRK